MYTFSEFPIFALTSIFSSKVDLYVLLDILITQGPVTYDVLIDRAPSIYIKRTFFISILGDRSIKTSAGNIRCFD
jgi:hypothetical protein